MRSVTCALLFAFMSFAAWAQPSDESAAQCSLIEDSLRRLLCFDTLFPKKPISPTETSAKPEATTPDFNSAFSVEWTISEDKSPLDDSVKISAGLTPSNVGYSGIGDGQAFLVIRCHENVTSVIISTNMFMSDDSILVTTRMGQEKAVLSRWSRSSDYKAVGLWSGGAAIPFIRGLAGQQKLAVRVEARDRLDAEFDLGNVASAAAKIAAACGWKL